VGTIPDLVSINAQGASVRGPPLLQAFAFPRQDLPEFCQSSRTSEMRARGMPGAGRTHGPPATRKAGGSDHRFSRNNRHSPRNGVRLITPSPRGAGLDSPRRPRDRSKLEIAPGLDPSIGRSGPRAFAIRADIIRQLMPKHPSQPAPRFVTIAIRPSVWAPNVANHTPDFGF